MAFTKITNAELNAVGATTQPNVPTIGATALKQVFDAPAKQVVAPKVNNLIDELQASTAAADLGAVAPTGRTGTSVQSVLDSISSDLGTAEAQSHAHPNKTVIDKLDDDGTGLTYDGNPVGAVTSVNSQTGAVVLTASDVGALPSTTAIPTKTSDLTNDSNFVADASYVHTDNNYDATAKGIVDGATAAIAAKSTVAWNQNITTGQKIATVTIDGTPTDVYAPTGGGGGGGAVDSVNGQTGVVVLDAEDVGAIDTAGDGLAKEGTTIALDLGMLTGSNLTKAVSGKDIYDAIEQIYADNGVLGAKNISKIQNGNNVILCSVKNGQTYTFSLTSNGHAGFSLRKNTSEGTSVTSINATTAGRNSVSFTADSDFDLFLNGFGRDGQAFANATSDFQLELGSTATPYVPYAMTNRELTEEKLSISELKTIASSAADFAAFKTAIANL